MAYDDLSSTVFRFTKEDKEKIDNYKGSYNTVNNLIAANPTPKSGNWGIVESINTIYIHSNGSWVPSATKTNIVDTLTSDSTNSALSANQGKKLNEKIDEIEKISVSNDLSSNSISQAMSINLGRLLNENKIDKSPSTTEDNITKKYVIQGGKLSEAKVLPTIQQSTSNKFLTNNGIKALWSNIPESAITQDAPKDGSRYVRKNGQWVLAVNQSSGNNAFAYGDRRQIITMALNHVNQSTIGHGVDNLIDGKESTTFQLKNSYDYKNNTPVFYFTLSERQRPTRIYISVLGTHNFGKFTFQASENGVSGWHNIANYQNLDGSKTIYAYNTNMNTDESYYHYRFVGHDTEDCTIGTLAEFGKLTMDMGDYTITPLQSEPADGQAYIRKNGKWVRINDVFGTTALVDVINSETNASVNLLPSHTYLIDTSYQPIQVYVPDSPTVGDTIEIIDYRGIFGTNACIVNFPIGTMMDGMPVIGNRYSLSMSGFTHKFIFISDAYGWAELGFKQGL